MKITSIKDPIILEARNLQSSAYREQVGKALLYGFEQIKWAHDYKVKIECIFVEEGNAEILSQLDKKYTVAEVTSGILKKISNTKYVVPCLAIACPQKTSRVQGDFVVVMDNLHDFGNIGSVVRTAKGLGVEQIIFANMQSDPFQRKIIDSARGQVFNSKIMQIAASSESVKYLKDNDYQIVVTSPHAKSLQSQAPLSSKKLALVVGNETSGVSDLFLKAADLAIKIPMHTQVESLNVSVAAGVSIYELKFKQVLMMLKEKIVSNLGRQINLTGKLIRMAFDKQLKECTDLSGGQVVLMMIMHCDGKMSAHQISKDAYLGPENINNFLGPLIEKKLIKINEDTYSLTEAGVQFLAEVWPITQITYQKITSELTDEEVDKLSDLLLKLEKGCVKLL